MTDLVGIVRMEGKPVISCRAWAEATTKEQRADLWEALIRQQWADAGAENAGFDDFVWAWLDRNASRQEGFLVSVVGPGYWEALTARFFSSSSPDGQEGDNV